MDNALYDFFRRLDRSLFIENENKIYADYDSPLSIGLGQTISQPSLVYKMTELLELDKDMKVLEIGTGSGYQTAMLAAFAGQVYTVERLEELAVKAQKRLKSLGYGNITYKIGDGSEGWEEHAPFDRIIVTAAAGEIPRQLIRQLAPEGLMIIPVGEKGLQKLARVTKDEKNNFAIDTLGDVTFVELVGEYGWKQNNRSFN